MYCTSYYISVLTVAVLVAYSTTAPPVGPMTGVANLHGSNEKSVQVNAAAVINTTIKTGNRGDVESKSTRSSAITTMKKTASTMNSKTSATTKLFSSTAETTKNKIKRKTATSKTTEHMFYDNDVQEAAPADQKDDEETTLAAGGLSNETTVDGDVDSMVTVSGVNESDAETTLQSGSDTDAPSAGNGTTADSGFFSRNVWDHTDRVRRILGIAFFVIIGLVAIVVICICCLRKKQKRLEAASEKQASSPAESPSTSPSASKQIKESSGPGPTGGKKSSAPSPTPGKQTKESTSESSSSAKSIKSPKVTGGPHAKDSSLKSKSKKSTVK